MLVRQILKAKAAECVFTIVPGKTLADAAEELSVRRIGVLMVSADGETLDGIISERDIVRELGRRKSDCLPLRIEEVMTRSVITCTLSDRSDALLQTMSDGRFRHMPVIDDGKIIGMISQGDVVKARLDELSLEKEALEGMIMGR